MKHINRYSIIYNSVTTVLEFAPVKWEERNRSLKRSDSAIGLFRTFTADLTFIKDGFDLLNSIEETDGINANVQLLVEKMNPKTGIYAPEPLMQFDFTELSYTTEYGKGIKIALISSGFEQVLDARKAIEVPYDRLTTIDGATITPYPAIDTDFGGGLTFHDTDGYRTAKIFGIDVADKGVPYVIDEQTYSTTDTPRNVVLGISTNYVNPLIQEVASREFGGAVYTLPGGASTTDCFFYTNGFARVNYDVNLLLNHRSTLSIQPNDWDLRIVLYKAVFDTDGNPIAASFVKIYEQTNYTGPLFSYLFATSGIIDLEPNEGLILYAYHYAINSLTFAQSNLTVLANSYISLDYSDKYNTTYTKFILPHEAFERSIEGYTGIKGFYSEPFGRTDLGYAADGEYAYIALTDGMLLRGFPQGYIIDEADDDANKVAQLTFSFEKLFDFFNKNKCLGWTIETIDGVEKVVIKKREDFFNDTIITDVPAMEMHSYSRTREPKLYFNSIKLGCEVEAYENTSGLEEYCGISEFATCIKPVANPLELITEYKTACYAVEFVRRYPMLEYSTTDTQYDSYIMAVDMVLDTDGNLMQRTDEGFTTFEGIPLITTPMNLNLTPARALLRWGFWLNAGLWKYPAYNLVYSKSSFVTDLKTLKTGESELLAENDNFLNNRLDNPVLSGYRIEFSAPLTDVVWDLIVANPGGILRLTDQITGEIIYMAIDSVTSEPQQNKPTNWSGYECYPADIGTFKVLIDYNGLIFMDHSNKLIQLT